MTERLLDPGSTAAVLLGASDWTTAGMAKAASFRRSAKELLRWLIDSTGARIDPELVLDLFDDPTPADAQLAHMRDTLSAWFRERQEEGRSVADLLLYYIGHGTTDDAGHLTLLVRGSRAGLETETGIRTLDLARVLRVAAPQQRRLVVLDCCFAEAAARAFVGMGALDQAVAATAAKDIATTLPGRGGLLLCSSPVGEVSIGAPNSSSTLFSGAVLDVLRNGAPGRPAVLSFADLRDAAHEGMVKAFGSAAPRPVLHAVNQALGDLSRLPAFPNVAPTALAAPPPSNLPGLPGRSHGLPGASVPSPAVCFDRGYELDIKLGNQVEAARWYRLAADRGHAKAQNMLGLLLESGQGGVVRDEPEAARLFGLAAAQGHASAHWNLGKMYEYGQGGLPRDLAEARRLYEFAADNGVIWARQRLVELDAWGTVGLNEPDVSDAAGGVRLFAEMGYPDSQYRLGCYYRDGDECLKRNEAEAARWFRLAASQGYAEAQNDLGCLLDAGADGVPENRPEAARLFRFAAEQGNAVAQYNLARYYENGFGGLPRSLEEARRLYRQAAEQGHRKARERLKQLSPRAQ